jgi:putative peptide maturation dehydrogenase
MRPDTLLRRCAALAFLPQETLEVDLPALLGGAPPLARTQRLLALAAHRDEPLEVDAREVAALARLSPTAGTPRAALVELDDAALARLLVAGLVVREDAGSAPDDALRAVHWEPLAAVAHRHLRWRGVRTPDARPDAPARSLAGLVRRLGPPPEATPQRGDASARRALPAARATATASLLRQRATCRNFDPARPLPLELAATLLHGVFGAQARVAVDGGAEVLKKLSPSGGGLHPTECYLLAADVDGIEPGIWHYRAGEHALDPLRRMSREALRAFALTALAGQDWFADAPLMVVHACRFGRTFWKYRQHPKAYRAAILDIGHLSQTALTLATELGLGAFVTAAINEADIETELGLDPMTEGPLAVCGFGWRGAARVQPEFDPLHAVWPDPAT